MALELGQYSLVSYVHALRNERINLGVMVWHPLKGTACRFAKNRSRVRMIDENANLTAIRDQIEEICETFSSWTEEVRSPLEHLSSAYKHDVVVSPPLNARIQDPAFTLERLYSTLMAPEPFARAASTTQFARSFVSQFKNLLTGHVVGELRDTFTETQTFKPIEIALWYQTLQKSVAWRAFSFSSLDRIDYQLAAAKAIHAENSDLIELPEYGEGEIAVAVQMPKPKYRQAWDDILAWLGRSSTKVTVFEDKESISPIVAGLVDAI